MHIRAVPQAAKLRGFFTKDEAIAAGWTPRAIRTQLKRGLWITLASGRYVEAHVFGALSRDQQHRVIALATAYNRNLVIRRDSAACVHGFSVARTPRVVAARHRCEFQDHDVTEIHGAAVTTAACTVVESARALGAREGLVIADSALRSGRTTREDLNMQLAAVRPNGKGVAAATFVVREGNARAETAIESISRYEFIVAGLPRPEPQAWIGNRRVDFLFEKYRVIGEADGIGKYGRNDAEIRANITAERRRQRELEDAGYVFVRWLWDDIWYRPHLVIASVLQELEKRGYAAS